MIEKVEKETERVWKDKFAEGKREIEKQKKLQEKIEYWKKRKAYL